MMKRREAISLMGSISAGTLMVSARSALASAFMPMHNVTATQGGPMPQLAPGTPTSPERVALIEAFKKKSVGLDATFEARTYKSDWEMPYRLFRPEAPGRLPLVMYLHGAGGLGTDNLKQIATGNVFGTRVWLLPEHQKRFPCFVVAPQTDRGWIPYAVVSPGDTVARPLPGLGDGARVALEIIDALGRELPIDERRIYVVGQSMGGGGVWNMTAHRPNFFAAAVACCGVASADDGTTSVATPMWNFHGDADETVPVATSRARIAAMRKAGGHPLYTEYVGVGHNVWQWAFTEPALLPWLFSTRRAG